MKYNEVSAIARIERCGGAVAKETKVINHKYPGIKVLGAIDYLVKVHGYVWVKA